MHWRTLWRDVNPMPIVVASCLDVDPKIVANCGRTKLSQLGLNVAVTDARQKRISLCTNGLSCRLWHGRSVGPETNVDVIVTFTDLLTRHLCWQQYKVTCHNRHQVALLGFTKRSPGFHIPYYSERLGRVDIGQSTLELRCLRADLIRCYKIAFLAVLIHIH